MNAIINGINLAYDDHGSGPAVVLIHGFPLCRKMWYPQIKAVTAAGFRLVTIDLRGFGESDVPESPYSMDIFSDDVVGLMDYLGIERAVVGGMSMGGYVLFNLAERHAGRLAGAAFIATRATADDEAGKARRLRQAQDMMKFGPQVIADAFVPILFAEASLAERPRLVEEVGGWIVGTDSRGLAGGLLAMRERKDYNGILGNFGMPSIAIGAEDDRAAPPETSRAIAAGIPGCRLAIVSAAGHMANLEHPGAFNDALIGFLKELGRW